CWCAHTREIPAGLHAIAKAECTVVRAHPRRAAHFLDLQTRTAATPLPPQDGRPSRPPRAGSTRCLRVRAKLFHRARCARLLQSVVVTRPAVRCGRRKSRKAWVEPAVQFRLHLRSPWSRPVLLERLFVPAACWCL